MLYGRSNGLPGGPKRAIYRLTGGLEVEQRGCRWETVPTHVQKGVEEQKGSPEIKSILVSCSPSLATPTLSLQMIKITEKAKESAFLVGANLKRAMREIFTSVFSMGGLYGLLFTSSTLSYSLLHLVPSYLCCLPWQLVMYLASTASSYKFSCRYKLP